MIIYSMLALLLSNAVTLRRDKSILYSRKTVIILLCSCLLVAKSLDVSFLDRGVGLYGGLFHATPITHTFHLFIFFLSAIILQLTAFYPRKAWLASYTDLPGLFTRSSAKPTFLDDHRIDNRGGQFKIIEYPLLLIFIIIGGTFLVSASDIVSIFLSIELQSYGLYLLSTLYRNSELATSAGLTYFLLGGLSSCFILLGTSLLYANSGTTSLDGYYVLTGLSSTCVEATGTESATASEGLSYAKTPYNPLYLNVSLSLMSVGFLFKISAAPFHFWSPGVYDAIPTIVTTFVAIVAKISILVFLLETAHYTSSFFSAPSFSWTSGLLFSSFLSLIVGSVLGLTQARIKRLFAYSTISHIGFILLALSINSLESTQGFLFYLMVYSISNVNAFILLVTIGFSLYPFLNVKADNDNDLLNDNHKALLDRNNSPIQITSQMKGYFSLNPVLALSLGITLFSFVGIPPLAGFFAKQMVLSAALDSGYVFLALVAILTSVVSAVYYLGVIKQIFFDDYTSSLYASQGGRSTTERGLNLQDTSANSNSSALSAASKLKIREDGSRAHTAAVEDTLLSFSLTVTISILTLALLSFIFTPQESLSMTSILALTLFNP